MLALLERKSSNRKLRLFAVACCRRLTSHFKDHRSLEMVEASEQFADEMLDRAQLELAFNAAAEAQVAVHWEGGDAVDQSSAEAVLGLRNDLAFQQVFERAVEAAGAFSASEAWDRIYSPPARHWSETEREHNEAEEAGERTERTAQSALLRDIFGNPFRPVSLESNWLTIDSVSVARGIYDGRAFERMPILADALQDAGCDNEEILGHCRGDGPHVKGCWVVDLVLGKQ